MDKEATTAERPQHEVTLRSFAMMEHPVRVSDFEAFIIETKFSPSKSAIFFNGDDWEMGDLSWEDPGYSYTPDSPVTCVTFRDVEAFTKWFGKKTGLPYRLPTEAEWEVAARAGTATSRFWGNTMRGATRYANVSTGRRYKAVSPVKSFAANPWGLYDMLGNVFEWTASDYRDPYDGSELKCSQSSELKAYRGGSFNAEAALIRCSARAGMPPDLASNQIGFRLCADASAMPLKTVKSSELTEEINKLKFGQRTTIKIDLSDSLDRALLKKARE